MRDIQARKGTAILQSVMNTKLNHTMTFIIDSRFVTSIFSSSADKGPASVHCDDEDDCIGGFGSGESPVDDSNNGYDHPYSPGDNKKPTPGDEFFSKITT